MNKITDATSGLGAIRVYREVRVTNDSDHASIHFTEPTLGHTLRRAAYGQLPSRFYLALEFAAPLAIQAALDGWYRVAGWLCVISCFGLWALGQQQVAGYADRLESLGPPSRAWRYLRRGAAIGGSSLAVLLGAEAFVRLMAAVFKCPGCAG